MREGRRAFLKFKSHCAAINLDINLTDPSTDDDDDDDEKENVKRTFFSSLIANNMKEYLNSLWGAMTRANEKQIQRNSSRFFPHSLFLSHPHHENLIKIQEHKKARDEIQ